MGTSLFTSKMRLLPLLLAALTVGFSSATPLGDRKSELVFGGGLAAPGAFPNQVFIRLRDEDGNSFRCGGALISTTHVLTAGHCTDGSVVQGSTIMVGAVNLDSPDAVWRNIRNFTTHPQYDAEGNFPINDIAVVEFDPPVVLGKDIQLTKIVEDDDELMKSATATVTGFGSYTLDNNNETLVSDNLRYTEINLFSRDFCDQKLKDKDPADLLKDYQFCAGARERGNGEGDSGGPIQVHHNNELYQIGLISFGETDPFIAAHDQDKVPAYYTRVSKFCDFIDSATEGVARCGCLSGDVTTTTADN